MKILVVNNGTRTLNELVDLLSPHQVDVVSYSDIDVNTVEKYKAIILTGGHEFSVFGHEKLIEKEIYLIRNSKKPIFGICLGFEIIAYAFGSKLEILKNKEQGTTHINVVVPSEIFSNTNTFGAYESHRWILKEMGSDLLALAISKSGIEAIKHKHLPIYGVQFHPEKSVNKESKSNALLNFLELVENMRQ
ncbi:MAG: gamma-glutamyl-gamma-aminobutyrate hydrolase family protein [Candidatus Roizmanbacteria bacterium]